MISRRFGCREAALALALITGTTAPGFAQAPPPPGPPPEQPKKHHHDSGVGAAIGAGLVGGLVGGALLNGQRQAPGYPPPQPAYAPPPLPPPTYEDADDEPVCRVVRKPVYDEDGEIVDYGTRRICR